MTIPENKKTRFLIELFGTADIDVSKCLFKPERGSQRCCDKVETEYGFCGRHKDTMQGKKAKKILGSISVEETRKILRKNQWGNYEDAETHIVFDRNTRCAYGIQNHQNGYVYALSEKDVKICKNNSWDYIIRHSEKPMKFSEDFVKSKSIMGVESAESEEQSEEQSEENEEDQSEESKEQSEEDQSEESEEQSEEEVLDSEEDQTGSESISEEVLDSEDELEEEINDSEDEKLENKEIDDKKSVPEELPPMASIKQKIPSSDKKVINKEKSHQEQLIEPSLDIATLPKEKLIEKPKVIKKSKKQAIQNEVSENVERKKESKKPRIIIVEEPPIEELKAEAPEVEPVPEVKERKRKNKATSSAAPLVEPSEEPSEEPSTKEEVIENVSEEVSKEPKEPIKKIIKTSSLRGRGRGRGRGKGK